MPPGRPTSPAEAGIQDQGSVRPTSPAEAGTRGPGPIRTCVGCRRQAEAGELIRFTGRDGQVIVGAGQPGRGAWLCRDRLLECFDLASEGHAWARSLRVRIDRSSLLSLRRELVESYGL